MKKVILFATVFLFIRVSAQMTVEDAKGETSILFKPSNIGLNIGEASISAGWNNFRKQAFVKPQTVLWGLNINSKNKEGLASLLDEGHLEPDSKLQIFFGIQRAGSRREFLLSKQVYDLENAGIVQEYKYVSAYQKPALNLINESNLSSLQKKLIRDTLKFVFAKNMDIRSELDLLYVIKKGYDDKAEIARTFQLVIDFLAKRKDVLSGMQKNLEENFAKIDSLNEEFSSYRKTHKAKSAIFYIRGGLSANTLTLYDSTSTGGLINRFDTAEFRGAFVDLGINYDVGKRWSFGFTGGYEKYNNIDSLESSSYSLRTSTTQGSQQLSAETKYTAYPGTYISYDRISFKTDAYYFGALNDQYRFVWNTIYSRIILPVNEERIEGIIELGSGINFYKSRGKFVGGTYLQINDVTNNMQSENGFFKRLAFGLVAKFTFTSIVDRIL
jgi:hypothetical protein